MPDTQPVIEDEPKTPEEDAPLCSPEDAPAPMGATVDYFLLKTGRSGISAAELSAVRALGKRHTPARIQTEIGKAVDPNAHGVCRADAIAHQVARRTGGGWSHSTPDEEAMAASAEPISFDRSHLDCLVDATIFRCESRNTGLSLTSV